MARARNIKPSFFQNDSLAEIDPLGRLLFVGMWTISDFKGCLEYRPKRIKAQLLAYDDCDTEALLMNLDKSGFISIYSVRGVKYIKIINFEKHQNPHKNERESGSDIPDIEEKDSEISELKQDGTTPDKNGTAPADSLLLIPDSLNLKPNTPKANKSPAPPAGDADLFPGVDPQVVSDFKALRKSKKAPVTKTAMDKIVAEAEKAGMSLDAVLRVCCSRGWQGFNAEWVAGKQAGQPVQQKTSRHAGFEHIDYSEGIEDGRIT